MGLFMRAAGPGEIHCGRDGMLRSSTSDRQWMVGISLCCYCFNKTVLGLNWELVKRPPFFALDGIAGGEFCLKQGGSVCV